MLTYDQVIDKFCLCDVVMYLKAKDGVVIFPEKYVGMRVERALENAKGVTITTERAGLQHIFVVRTSAFLKKAAALPAVLARA